MESGGTGSDLSPLASAPASNAEEGPNREDRVQNAVQFLVHPKVQNRSMEERRNFLVKKGLTSKGVDSKPTVAHTNSPQHTFEGMH